MEEMRQISNDSFSYSWLSNSCHSFNCREDYGGRLQSFNVLDGKNFVEMDADLFSLRWTVSNGFRFDHPSSNSDLVDANQIFSNGYLLPLHLVIPLETKDASPISSGLLCSAHPSSSLHSNSSRRRFTVSCANRFALLLLRRCIRFLRENLMKILNFLTPLHKNVLKSFKVIISSMAVRSCRNFSRSSFRMNRGLSSNEWRRGNYRLTGLVDAERSIDDAVLHCRK